MQSMGILHQVPLGPSLDYEPKQTPADLQAGCIFNSPAADFCMLLQSTLEPRQGALIVSDLKCRTSLMLRRVTGSPLTTTSPPAAPPIPCTVAMVGLHTSSQISPPTTRLLLHSPPGDALRKLLHSCDLWLLPGAADILHTASLSPLAKVLLVHLSAVLMPVCFCFLADPCQGGDRWLLTLAPRVLALAVE